MKPNLPPSALSNLFGVLIVSRIEDTTRWITEYVVFRSRGHAQPFFEGTALRDLPSRNVVESFTIFPPNGQTPYAFSMTSGISVTSSSQSQAIAVASAVRNSPPDHLKPYLVDRSTSIYVVDPYTQALRDISAERSLSHHDLTATGSQR